MEAENVSGTDIVEEEGEEEEEVPLQNVPNILNGYVFEYDAKNSVASAAQMILERKK